MSVPGPSRRDGLSPLAEALCSFSVVTVLCTLLVRGRAVHPLIADHGATVVGMLFLLVPALAARRRDRDLTDYGFRSAGLARSLVLGVGMSLIVLPLFALATYESVAVVCASAPATLRSCRCLPSLRGFVLALPAALPARLGQFAFTQVAGVALPEELFYRGYLQTLLSESLTPSGSAPNRWWPVSWRVLALQAGLFALTHVATGGSWSRMSVFFPALLFGWLRGTTGSIVAGALFHAACNVAMATIERAL